MLRLQGMDGFAPTRLLSQALHSLDPDLWHLHPGWETADLAIQPRCTRSHAGPQGCRCPRRYRAWEGAWYDVVHTHPKLVTAFDGGSEIVQVRVGPVLDVLPAPELRPFADRLAEQGEPTLEGWSQEAIDMMGGPTQALGLVRQRQRRQAEHLTADSWDWKRAARDYLPVLHCQPRQELFPAQAAEAARVRLWLATCQVEDARKSLTARQNAPVVRPDRVEQSRERLAAAEAELAEAHAMVERTRSVTAG